MQTLCTCTHFQLFNYGCELYLNGDTFSKFKLVNGDLRKLALNTNFYYLPFLCHN